jgi:sugar phosphate isomerase/epimerase
MPHTLTRRQALGAAAAVAAAGVVPTAAAESQPAAPPSTGRFRYCLNTSTIRGQKLGVEREIEVAAAAGYDAIEPWMGTIGEYTKAGGSLADLNKRIKDAGLTVESAIGFARWIVDDDAQRAKGLEDAKRDMDVLAQLGGKRIAAPPSGASGGNDPKLDLFRAAERYHALLKVGDETGVVPQVEVWGFSKNLSRLGESMFVVIEAGHPKACLLPDVYHIYKGGSDFHGLKAISGSCIGVFHMNDYPADPPRATINDGHRVYPGDGVAPLTPILRDVAAARTERDGPMVLSLELFNRTYWEQDPLAVAKTGLAKMKAAVAAAGV